MTLQDSTRNGARTRLFLDAETAADLMTPNPVSLPPHATVREAAAVLTEKEISAVLIVEGGRPVGVLSRADLVRYLRQLGAPGAELADPDCTPVRDLMTPVVISVPASLPVIDVVAQILAVGRVHRLFVLDDAGTAIGVISVRDVLRKLRKADSP